MFEGKRVRRLAGILVTSLIILVAVAVMGGLDRRGTGPGRAGEPFAPAAAASQAASDTDGSANPPPSPAAVARELETPAATTDPDRSGAVEPKLVTLGFLINDIQDIDLQRHRYQLDMYIWYRWWEPELDPAGSIEFMNDAERWATVRTPAFDAPLALADGSLYFRERVMSVFATNMPLENYPYDQLDLVVELEDAVRDTDELRYVLDDPPVELATNLNVPGYVLGTPTVTVTDWTYPPMGLTAADPASGTGQATSRVTLTVPMARPWLPSTLRIFVPFMVVVVCAAFVFFVHPRHVDVRFALAISSLLTLIALKWTTDSEMPLLDYLGLVDALYLLAFVCVGLGLAETTLTAWRRGQGVADAVLVRTGRRVFAVAAAIFLVGSVAVFLAYLG